MYGYQLAMLEQRQYSGLLGSLCGHQQETPSTRPGAVPDEEGWYNWEEKSPPTGKLIQIHRNGWEGPSLLVVADYTDPAYQSQQFMNASGLKWRLTGIAKETE